MLVALQALNHDHEGLLPGPLNTLKGLFYGKDHVSSRMNITLRQCERDLRSKWGTLCSRSRFCDIVHAVASKELEARPDHPHDSFPAYLVEWHV